MLVKYRRIGIEHQTDQMVYELCGLMPEEIVLVEGVNKE